MDASFPPEGVPPPVARQPAVDARAWKRMADQWAQQQAAPWLVGEVADRLADRLTVLRQPPARVALWEPEGRWSLPAIQSRLPHAELSALRPTAVGPQSAVPADRPQPGSTDLWAALSVMKSWGRFLGRRSAPPTPSVFPHQPVAWVDQPAQWQEHPVDLVWSNLELHRHADPARLLRQWHAALRTDGLLLFSTWGPDTLRQLSWAWDEAQWGPAAQPWVDMHDWGDAMVEAGFDDPVMDQERITLTWADASSALRELRALGRNAHPQRFAGCRGRQWRMAMTKALERCRAPDGRIALDFEVIYGHAVRGRERMPLAPETRISVESMRQSLRNRHR